MILEKKKSNFLFAVLLTASIGASLLQTSLTTALPAIMQDLDISASTGQWLTSAYSLAMGIMVPATAFLMKRFSTRKLFFGAVFVFLAGTFLSFAAGNFTVLFAGRILQALGSGILLPMTQVVILTIYPPQSRGMAMGIYGLAVGAAPVVAPTLAGIIIDVWNWRMIFLIVFGILTVDLILAVKAMQNVTETEKLKFDFWSMLLCSCGFSALLIGAGNIGADSILYVIVPLVIGILIMLAFIKRQCSSEKPFLELRIFSQKDYRMAVIISMLLYAVMMAGSTLFPIFIQNVMGKSAMVSGLIMMPGSLVMAAISPLTGKIYDRFGIRKLAIFGSLIMFISCLGVTFINAGTSVIYIAAMYILRLISIGCLMMPIVTWGMSMLPSETAVDGTALLTSLRTISGAFGAAVFVAIMSMFNHIFAAGSEYSAVGFDIAFAGLTVIAAVQLICAIGWVGKKE